MPTGSAFAAAAASNDRSLEAIVAEEEQANNSNHNNSFLDEEEEEDNEEDDRQLLTDSRTRLFRSSNRYRSLLPSALGGGSTNGCSVELERPSRAIATSAAEPSSRLRPVLTQSHFDARYRFTRPKQATASSWWSSLCHRQLLHGRGPTHRCLSDRVRGLFPFIDVMQQYQWRNDLPADVIAGLTVGIMNIPQGMAYAMLAELPPVCGLYLGFFPLILYFFFGTSRQVSVGTFALSSLMVAVPVARLVGGGGEGAAVASSAVVDILGNVTTSTAAAGNWSTEETAVFKASLDYYRVQVALSVTLLAGLAQLSLGLLRFGFITIYLSTPLVSGFTTGAAFHVATSQVPALFGVSVPRHVGAFKLARAYVDIAQQLPATNLATLAISASCIGLLLLFRLFVNAQLAKRCRVPVPIELLLVVAATAGSHFGHLHSRCRVDIVGHIPSGLQPPRVPSVRLFPLIWQDALLLAVVMYVCTFSICKLYANKHGYGLDSNQELLAGGVVNSVGPLFGCYFAAGSLSRSQVQEDMGGRTQIASLIAAGLMVFVLLFLGPLFRELPTAVLACIIIVALKGLFMQFRDAKQLFGVSRYDFSIWLVCFLAVVVLNVSYGLVIGFAYSLLTVVCRTQSPSASLLGRLPTTDIYKDVRYYPSALRAPGVAVFRFDGALYFASVDNFRYRLVRLTGFDPKRPEDAEEEEDDDDGEAEEGNELETDEPPADAASSSSRSSSRRRRRRLHHIVIECSGINYIDSVGASCLRSLTAQYSLAGVTLLFACCKHQFRRMCERSQFADQHSAMFVSVHDAVLAALADYPNQRDRIVDEVRRGSVGSGGGGGNLDDNETVLVDDNNGGCVGVGAAQQFREGRGGV